jgi:hypothetical protein
MLDLPNRGAIVVLAALSVAGAMKLASGTAPSSFTATPRQALPYVARGVADPLAAVAVRRDPFAEPAAPAVIGAMTPAPATPRETVEALPSNLADDTIPALPGTAPDVPASSPRVTAIVTGPHPYAMLDAGGVHELKGLGDRVRGVTIVAIDLAGVRLRDGERLTIDSAARP